MSRDCHIGPVPAELRAGGLVETLLSRNGSVLRLAAHLARLERSCRELYGASVPEDLGTVLQQTASDHGGERTGLRVRVVPGNGRLDIPGVSRIAVTVESWHAPAPPSRLRLVHAPRPDWCWRHKWGDRTALLAAESMVGSTSPGEIDVLPYFTTSAGNVAETSRGNLCCLGIDGVWRTPPEDEDLLPGITRRDVLQAWTDAGRPFSIGYLSQSDLHAATAVLTTSSISGVVIVDRIDDRRLAIPHDLELEVSELNRRLGFG